MRVFGAHLTDVGKCCHSSSSCRARERLVVVRGAAPAYYYELAITACTNADDVVVVAVVVPAVLGLPRATAPLRVTRWHWCAVTVTSPRRAESTRQCQFSKPPDGESCGCSPQLPSRS